MDQHSLTLGQLATLLGLAVSLGGLVGIVFASSRWFGRADTRFDHLEEHHGETKSKIEALDDKVDEHGQQLAGHEARIGALEGKGNT